MKQFLLFCLLCLHFFTAQAQKNFRPGYIVQGTDTLKGLVNFRQPKTNALSCQFKSSPKGKILEFSGSEINAYGFSDGIHYRSFLLNETSATLAKHKAGVKFYFLNVLVAGKASLYFVRDIAGQNRYFISKDSVLKELELKTFRIANGKTGRQYNAKSKLYIGTLTFLMKDCNSLQPIINNTNFTRASLINTVRAYNHCLNPDSLFFVQKLQKSKTTVGVIGGPNYTFIKFSEPYQTFNGIAEYNNKPGYSVGITLNNTLPFLNERISFQTELLFVKNNFKANYTYNRFYPGPDLLNYNLKADFSLYSIKAPFQVRYSFMFTKLQPYINGGIVLNHDFELQERGEIGVAYRNKSSVEPIIGYLKHSFYLGFIGGAGILFPIEKSKAMFVELKYLPESINNLYGIPAEASTYFLSTGFRF